MVQRNTILYCSNCRFGSSAVQRSSFKAWPTFALRRYFQTNGSEDSAPPRKLKEADSDPQIDPKGPDALVKRLELFQKLIERAYAEIQARRGNR
jgi:hypothetical protein